LYQSKIGTQFTKGGGTSGTYQISETVSVVISWLLLGNIHLWLYHFEDMHSGNRGHSSRTKSVFIPC